MARAFKEDPLQKFRYKVEFAIGGLQGEIKCTEISGLSGAHEVVKYPEAGLDHPKKMPGKTEYDDVTISKAAFNNDTKFFDEFKKKAEERARGTITITVLGADNAVSTSKYILQEAWVSKWEGASLDSNSSDVLVERITITYEEFVSNAQ